MKTATLTFAKSGVSIQLEADPINELILMSAHIEGKRILLTSDIDEVRDLYEMLPGLLVYYSSRMEKDLTKNP